MFEGDMEEGELEIGQIAATIHEVKAVKAIFEEVITEYQQLVDKGFERF
jgi:enoyl-[acyl-carrier protein] reductase II